MLLDQPVSYHTTPLLDATPVHFKKWKASTTASNLRYFKLTGRQAVVDLKFQYLLKAKTSNNPLVSDSKVS